MTCPPKDWLRQLAAECAAAAALGLLLTAGICLAIFHGWL